MSRTTGDGRVRSVDDLDVVVEADGHVTAPAPMLLPYMDAEFEDVREFYERSPNGSLEFSAASVASPLYLYERMKEREGKEGFSFGRPSDAGDLLEVMDEHGIDRAIANNLGFSPRRNPRHAAGLVNAYNNWVREEFDDYPDIYANMLGTPLDPAYTAAEIERVGDHDSVVGVQFLGTLLRPLPGDPQYDPIWEAASARDLPVAIHTGTGPRSFPKQFWSAETYAEDHVSAHPMLHMSILTSLVFKGTFERFPDLTVVMQEAGIGYVPYLKQRLDAAYAELGYEVPGVTRPPSEYIDDQVYFCTQPLGHTHGTPEHLAWQVEMAGVDNLLWSADVPHPDFDTPEELFNRIKPYFSGAELNKLMGKNAERVFGI